VTSRALAEAGGQLRPPLGAVGRYVTDERLRLALAATLLVGAAVHAAVGVQHAPSNFAALSVLSAIAQGGLAIKVMLQPSKIVYAAAAAAGLVLVHAYLINVTVGLPPLIAHTHGTGTHQLWGITLASPAPIDGEGILAKAAETCGVVLAGLLGRARR
jgi:hypothetical protein